MAKLRITIEKGKVTHDVSEVIGSNCRDLTRPYLEALGVPESDVKEEVKPEMHQQAQVDQSL